MEVEQDHMVMSGRYGRQESDGCHGRMVVSQKGDVVTLDSCLDNKSDIFHHNNENNQLERQVRPPKDVPLDAQSWT